MSKLARVQRRLIQHLLANQCKITDFYSRVAQIFGEAKGMAAIDDADMDEPELELDEVHDGEVCDDDRPENHIDQYDTYEDGDEDHVDEDEFEDDFSVYNPDED